MDRQDSRLHKWLVLYKFPFRAFLYIQYVIQFQELWVETPTEDGKSYYYHAMTRETTWTRPEGPNIKIMTQSEVETMNKMQHKPMDHDPSKMPPGSVFYHNHIMITKQFSNNILAH